MNVFWLMLLQILLKFMHQIEFLSQLEKKSTTLHEGPNSCLYSFNKSWLH